MTKLETRLRALTEGFERMAELGEYLCLCSVSYHADRLLTSAIDYAEGTVGHDELNKYVAALDGALEMLGRQRAAEVDPAVPAPPSQEVKTAPVVCGAWTQDPFRAEAARWAAEVFGGSYAAIFTELVSADAERRRLGAVILTLQDLRNQGKSDSCRDHCELTAHTAQKGGT
jgi:hypothetical protein